MPEFSRLLKVENLSALPVERELRATGEECRALAQRFRLEGLERLASRLRILPWNRGGIRVEGELQAHVVQRCVISLQPMPQDIAKGFVSFFAPPEALDELSLEALPMEMEAPEVIEADGVDLGELVAQQLCLALDPYPHLPGARMPDFAGAPPSPATPFAGLSRLPLPEKR